MSMNDTQDPHWEAHIPEDDGEMCRVRWSEPDADRRYLWVGHYPNTPWGCHAAARQAERFNEEKRCPCEFHLYRPRVTVVIMGTEMEDNLKRVQDILETVLAVEILEYHDSSWLYESPNTRSVEKQNELRTALELVRKMRAE